MSKYLYEVGNKVELIGFCFPHESSVFGKYLNTKLVVVERNKSQLGNSYMLCNPKNDEEFGWVYEVQLQEWGNR